MKHDFFKFYHRWKYIFDELDDKQFRTLFNIIIDYDKGIEPEINDQVITVAFTSIHYDLHNDMVKRKHIAKVRAEAGRKGGPNSGKSRRSGKKPRPKTTKKAFIPPTVEEAKAYIEEKGYNINAEKFVNFYAARGWMTGKSKMSNWKAAVNLWNTNQKNETKESISETNYFEEV